MAMTKKESAHVDALIKALAEARALRFPDYAEPSRLEAKPDQRPAEGWILNAYTGRVSKGWFTSYSHGDGPARSDGSYRSGSQGMGGPWYATKRDALQALRLAKTNEFARLLAAIDMQIDAAGKEPIDGSVDLPA